MIHAIVQKFRYGLIVLFCIVCIAQIAEGAEPRVLSPVDMVEISFLSDPTPSPDGRYVLYLRSVTDWQKNKSFKKYVLHDVSSGQQISTFPSASDTESFSAPIWSPDSKGFVTLLSRKNTAENEENIKKTKAQKKKIRQAYYYNIEARNLSKLTSQKTDVGNVQWSPDGNGFYFISRKPRADSHRELLDKKFAISAYEQKQPNELWHFDYKNRTTSKVISGDFFLRSYALSRDGSKIVYMRAAGPLGDDRHAGELWGFDIQTGESVQLTANTYAESDAQYSPDNVSIAYIATVNAKGDGYYEDNLFIQKGNTNEPILLLPKLPMEILDFAWNRKGDGLYILGNTGLRVQIYAYDTDSKALSPLTEGDHDIKDWSFNSSHGSHSYVAASALNPGEVHLLPVNGNPRQISSEFEDWPNKYRLPEQAAFNWKGTDGTNLDGLLVYPVGYQKGDRFPLVTVTHGGPRDSSRFGAWNMSRAVPVLAGQGYGVFLPNHRGGTGYGDKFMRDMVGGYFNSAHLDVMSGIDALIEAGLADPDRLIKQGWSAGGHMTNKLITFTDRFKAASSGAGASDWVSMYGESDVRYRRTPWFGGAPWHKNAPLDVYQKNSPLKDTWKVTTPTLFWSGGSDVRVPPTQGIMMYRGVKAAGADTKLYLAPDQPHGFRLPSYKLFKINTELAWYAKHLNKEIPPAVLPDIPEDASEPDETD